MGYVSYVGRVGALAVALGVGSAVATMPGVALAQPSDSNSSSPSSGESWFVWLPLLRKIIIGLVSSASTSAPGADSSSLKTALSTSS